MNCDCLDQINAKLKAENLRLAGYAYSMPQFKRIFTIDTEWIDEEKVIPKRNKKYPTKIFVSHCPFCGVKVPRPPDETL